MIVDHDYALTTIDNPYDPFEQFDSWLMFDKEKGYDCCEKLARTMKLTDDMTQKEIDEETERAIDEILKYDFTNIYKKVVKELKYDEKALEESIVDDEIEGGGV